MFCLSSPTKLYFCRVYKNKLPFNENNRYNSNEIIELGTKKYMRFKTAEEAQNMKEKIGMFIEENRTMYDYACYGSTDKLLRKVDSLKPCKINNNGDFISFVGANTLDESTEVVFKKYVPRIGSDPDIIKENIDKLCKIDSEARKRGEILGRYVQFPVGDSFAYYQVVSVCGNKVQVNLIRGVGSDCMRSEIKESGVISLSHAEQNIYSRDRRG